MLDDLTLLDAVHRVDRRRVVRRDVLGQVQLGMGDAGR